MTFFGIKEKIEEFIEQPSVGVEGEVTVAFSGLWFGAASLISPTSDTYMAALRSLLPIIPHQVLAIPWLFSSLTVFIGLFLFVYNKHTEASFRFVGGLATFAVWSWMFWKAAIATDLSLPILGTYLVFSLTGLGGMFGASYRGAVLWKHQR